MKTLRTLSGWKSTLLALLCLCSIPILSGSGLAVPAIPTGPHDAVNGTPDYYTTANWANSPPLAKFVDTLPKLGTPNNLGQTLSLGKADTVTYPGSDYYEIDLVEYRQQMHSDLPLTMGPTTGSTTGTLLRGYKQVNNGTDGSGNNTLAPDPVHYLGPIIVAQKDRPVRIKFRNRLPAGEAGKLFVPVDTSVMGAGVGPAYPVTARGEVGLPCDSTMPEPNGCAMYSQNRSDIHLHGGRTPWISDGTPHQWITPVEEITPFTKGVSFYNVPDMPDPGDGATTYYYSNQQSARLLFYHEHAWGITRLNPYVGVAAGYVLLDQWELDLIGRGVIPPLLDQIPLVIQDRTFVDATPTTKYIYNPVTGLFDTPITVPKVRETDPLWNWGSSAADPVTGVREPVTGDLWTPHVYMPAQNPLAGSGGVNPFGRWMYGPWFYPATTVSQGPVANPYYDPKCSDPNPFVVAECQTPGQPPQIPGTPNVSMGMEAFQDSAVVNGAAFPSLTVDPRAYRFRILNAANDRFQNLSFYVADPAQASTAPYFNPASPKYRPALSPLTEVKTVPASAQLAADNNWPPLWPVDGRDGGVPDPGVCTGSGDTLACSNLGPSFLQIATEGGFLPQPVERKPQPVTYITDPTAFWVGIVDQTGLALGPAERADVIVDFSQYHGKTLILYNDAPAAWPARVPGYDYYTGAPDLRDSGGYGTGGSWDPITGAWVGGSGPLPGYAPNTRTVMQVIVRPLGSQVDPPYSFDRARLEREFTDQAEPVKGLNDPDPVSGKTKTLFERAQEPIIVGQAAYSSAYPGSYFPLNFPWDGVNQINDQFLNFVTLAGEQVHAISEPKGLHDEMGASFDPVYGRMSGNLGMQLPNPTTLNALLVLYGYSDIPTEFVDNSTTVNVQVLPGLPGQAGTLADGTQIWKISHNGVDTHPIHFHIFDVQLVNRVGWDGQIALPEANELGWKDTIKISPLMDTIVAVRPRAPALPFGLPDSLRPLNPAIPIDSGMGFTPEPGSNWPIPGSTTGSGFSSIDWQTGQTYVANPGPPPFPYANYRGVVTNVLYNFGWEYVWHCHILSHEEMDMMRTIVLNYQAMLPPTFGANAVVNGGNVDVSWNDPTPVDYTDPGTFGNPANEVGFNVYRSTGGVFPIDPLTGKPSPLNPAPLLANSTAFTDTGATGTETYIVEAFNAKGSTFSYVNGEPSVTVSATGPFAYPATITLEATVSGLPAGITISQVAFYDGATLIGSDPTPGTAPYAFSWTGATVGVHSITARATTALGDVLVSAPVTVTVTGTLTADFTPADGSTFGVCDNITFTDTSTGGPTTWSWLINGATFTTRNVTTTLPQGIYPVKLGITDGAAASAQVTKTISVTGNRAPVAVTGGPYTVYYGASLTLNGSGSDMDACDVPLLTYGWNLDGKVGYEFTTAKPTISFNSLKKVLGIGTYTASLKVTDRSAASATATTTITVNNSTAPPAWVGAAVHNISNMNVWWAASATPGATYTVRATPSVGSAVMVSGITGTSTILNDLANGTYTVTVQADKTGVASSAPVAAASPVTINKVVAAPEWAGASAYGITGISVWWPLSTTTGATYTVTATPSGGGSSVAITGINATTTIFSDLPDGTYTITVRADREGWVSSSATAAASTVTIGRVVLPVAWVGANADNSASSISVWWPVSPTVGATYTVTATPSVGSPVVVSGVVGTAATISLPPNGVYTVTVRADLPGWTSSTPMAAASTVTVNKTAPAPAWLGIQKAGSSIKLWWPTSALAGAGYIITQTAGPNVGSTVTSGFLTSGGLKYIILTGLSNGTYSYSVTTTAAGYNNSSATGATTLTLP